MDRIHQEMDLFLSNKEQLKDRGFIVEDLDPFGFVIRQKSAPKKIELLITGLVHGDEVIGVDVINQVIDKMRNPADLKIDVAFLLCNIEAAKKGVRFIEGDLNRSFGANVSTNREHRRAEQISKILSQVEFVFDIHQTVEPALTPFFIFEHRHSLIVKAHSLLPEIPIVTFPLQGFSKAGKTLLEYAATVGCQAMTIECGQKGFSAPMAKRISKLCLRLMGSLKDSPTSSPETILVTHLTSSIRNSGGTELVPGMINFMTIQKGDILAHENGGPVLASFDGRLVFPRYGLLAKQSIELCSLGQVINYTDVSG